MTIRAVLAGVLVFACTAGPAHGAGDVKPRAGVQLTGKIDFPRKQAMTITTGAADGTRMTARLGFDGRCRGGGLGELWSSNVLAKPVVRVRDGRFNARLTGSISNVGGVRERTADFSWRFSGRFVSPEVVRATVTGTAVVRGSEGRVVSRCKIAKAASVRLTAR
jgi:hypothetical protein